MEQLKFSDDLRRFIKQYIRDNIKLVVSHHHDFGRVATQLAIFVDEELVDHVTILEGP